MTWLRLRYGLDLFVAAVLLIPCGLVVAVLAGVVLALTGRPALIRVPRIGRSGAEFGMWKIRSMSVGRTGGLAIGDPITAADDPRVTRPGRFIRRWHLDELPQLLNVLSGEMTIIGPRPEDPRYVSEADPPWKVILQVRPGLFGPSQILTIDREREALANGSSDSNYREKVLPLKLEIDAHYVQRASPSTDFVIALSLIEMMLGRSQTTLHRHWARRHSAA
jgi:lipopolysaccharide/colanic/teichoic acid biosynthesis glycosyltransferase